MDIFWCKACFENDVEIADTWCHVCDLEAQAAELRKRARARNKWFANQGLEYR